MPEPFATISVWPPEIPGFPLLSDKPLPGGFGEIYPAAQESLGGRRVCCKILRRRYVEDELSSQSPDSAHDGGVNWDSRLAEEAEIMASLQESKYVPDIIDRNLATVRVTRSLSDGTTVEDVYYCPYFVMEWIEGPRLDKFLGAPEGPWPQENTQANGVRRFRQLSAEWQTRLQNLFAEIARGLWDAHQQGVVHLDVTPRNILLEHSQHVKLIDWGLARRLGSDGNNPADMTLRGRGSPDYMAPEQVPESDTPSMESQCPIGSPADVYALGGIGYLLLTGEPPRSSTAENQQQRVEEMYAQAHSPDHHADLYERLRESGAPTFWVDLVTKCLCRHPQGRYQDASEVVREIDAHLAAQERRTRSRRAIALLAVLFTALAVPPLVRWEQAREQQWLVAEQNQKTLTEFRRRLASSEFNDETRDLARRAVEAFPDDIHLAVERLSLELIRASSAGDYDSVKATAKALDEQGMLSFAPRQFEQLIEQAIRVHDLAANVAKDGGMLLNESQQLRDAVTQLDKFLAADPDSSHFVVLRWMARVGQGIGKAYGFATFGLNQKALDELLAVARQDPAAELFYLASSFQMMVSPPKELKIGSTEWARWTAEKTAALGERVFDPGLPAVNASGRLYHMAAQLMAIMRLASARLDPDTSDEVVGAALERACQALANPKCLPELRLLGRGYALSVLTVDFDAAQASFWKGKTQAYRDRVRVLYKMAQRALQAWEVDEKNLPLTRVPWEGDAKQRLEDLQKRLGLSSNIDDSNGVALRVSRTLREHFKERVEKWYQTENARNLDLPSQRSYHRTPRLPLTVA